MAVRVHAGPLDVITLSFIFFSLQSVPPAVPVMNSLDKKSDLCPVPFLG